MSFGTFMFFLKIFLNRGLSRIITDYADYGVSVEWRFMSCNAPACNFDLNAYNRHSGWKPKLKVYATK